MHDTEKQRLRDIPSFDWAAGLRPEVNQKGNLLPVDIRKSIREPID